MLRRYAFVRQDDQGDCGAAALATIALHHDRSISLQQMRGLAGTDRVGTNLLGLLQAAEKLGFSARGVRASAEALRLAPLPAIAHLRTTDGLGHFVVLHRLDPGNITVADPARGIETVSRQEFCRRWTGHLLLMVPEARRPIPGGSVVVAPWRRLVALLGCHTPVLLEAGLCALLMTVLGVATSYFVQHLVDSVLDRHEVSLLNALGVGMVLLLGFRVLFGALRQYLLAHVGRRVDLALISRFARQVLRLPLGFFEMRRAGEILSRVNDAGKVRDAISGTATAAVVDGGMVALLLAVLWCYDLPLALVATAFVPLLVLGVVVHHPAARRKSREAMEQAALLSAHLVEDISAVETVKAFGVERARAEEGESRLVRFVQTLYSLELLAASSSSLGLLVTAGSGIVILWYGASRVMSGALTVGQLLFFYTLLGYLLEPLQRLASLNVKIQEALVAVDRLHQVLDIQPEPLGDGRKATFGGLRTTLELRDVSFRYGWCGNVLDRVNLHIPAGRTVAVVGESGSGKSTLLKLLLGFYSPTEGRLLVDGVDLRDVELASLRSRIGVVSQEPFIFNGSVRDNVALGMPGASLEAVIEATRAAGLEEFVNGLPERYDTLIGERGANLSGGQRQRLAIARAVLRRPDILIFDEATSHLDTATERAVQQSLRTTLAGKTVVLVAHRLSTIQNADLIYVLHQGRVVESGTHRELLAQRGHYAGLCGAQSEQTSPGHPSPRIPSTNGRAVLQGATHA